MYTDTKTMLNKTNCPKQQPVIRQNGHSLKKYAWASLKLVCIVLYIKPLWFTRIYIMDEGPIFPRMTVFPQIFYATANPQFTKDAGSL